MKKHLASIATAFLCLTPASVASVLEPENMGELLDSIALNYTDTGRRWAPVAATCSAVVQAEEEGVPMGALPSYLRGKGMMVPAACTVHYPEGNLEFSGEVAKARTERVIIATDPGTPGVFFLISGKAGGGYHCMGYAYSAPVSGVRRDSLWYAVDGIVRFPE